MGYAWFGDSLGGRPAEADLYDAGGHLRYDRVAATERFQQGIDALMSLAGKERVAMMCSEEDPTRCHRGGLVTPALLARGFEVIHIRGDGRLEPEMSFRLE